MDYKFKLKKLHCAGCALALEQNLNQIANVQAEINFVTRVLRLKITSDTPADTLTEVKIAITKFDKGIELCDFEDDDDILRREKQERNIKIFRFSVSAALLLLGLLFKPVWLKVFLCFTSYLLAAADILVAAARNVASGRIFDENFLMSIASIGAFLVGQYFEAVCVMLFFDIGEILQELAVSRSQKTIRAVLEIKQPYANLVTEGGSVQTDLKNIKVGDQILIKPGERVPLDAEVVSGTSYLDTSTITGETKEQVVSKGDKILSGCINGASVLVAKVVALDADSTVSKIIDMVQNASESKAKTEKFISKFSLVYTPTVIALAVLIMFLPPIIFGFHTFTEYAYRALSFLVVSCPCALVISVPLSYFAGIGAAAKMGIMVKSAGFLEVLSNVNAVVFDKTGTLTDGSFEVSEIFAANGFTEDEILELAAYAESYSTHKISKSLLAAYKERTGEKSINTAWIDGYAEIAGKGIKANIFMRQTLVGNDKLLSSEQVDFVKLSKPGTTVYVAVDGKFAGYIVISDTIKPDSKAAVLALKALKINDISLSTGDQQSAAEAVCSKLGIKNCNFGLLPEDKVLIITDMVQQGKTVAFVGDGINDAPSLASANVGISMGGLGSDASIEASDVVIMTDEPSKVARAIKKARQTKRIVLQNIIGSILVKALILGLISFGFAGMWLAVFADVGVSLLAVLNSLRVMINKK